MVKKGLRKPIARKGLKIRPSPAFPKVELEKIRQVIDSRHQNQYSRLVEKVQIKGTRTVQEIISIFMRPIGHEDAYTLPSSVSAKETWRQTSETLEKVAAQKPTATPSKPAEPPSVASRADVIAEVQHWNTALKKHKGGGVIPEMGTKDFEKYYYAFACRDPKLNGIAFYDPDMRVWQRVESYVLNMGNTHSVPGGISASTLAASPGGIQVRACAHNANQTDQNLTKLPP
ncbi:unnamed protein product [Amoebophrya sp. A120]|nr:unnamed protein product [Amoebophrya sp. A120]|eukprot:GSA120T00016669001.1